MEGTGGVYRPRQPKLSQFYQCIEDHFDQFEQLYPERYEREYGFGRPVVQEVILKYLDCRDLHQGFARIRCQECEKESLLAFSYKGRYFCPSGHRPRVVSLAQWVEEEVLEKVPHRQYVFTIPKCLRIYFKYDRELLGELSRCAYENHWLYGGSPGDQKDRKFSAFSYKLSVKSQLRLNLHLFNKFEVQPSLLVD